MADSSSGADTPWFRFVLSPADDACADAARKVARAAPALGTLALGRAIAARAPDVVLSLLRGGCAALDTDALLADEAR